MVENCLKFEPEQRPTFDEIVSMFYTLDWIIPDVAHAGLTDDGHADRIRLDPFKYQVEARVRTLGEGFVGRTWLADKVEAELAKHTQMQQDSGAGGGTSNQSKSLECPPPAVVIFGDSGTGKSSFVCRVLDGEFCSQKKGAWQRLHDRILARHLCSINDDTSLDPVKWAGGLAGQVFLRATEAGKMAEAIAEGGHKDRESLVRWIEQQSSARHLLTSWVLPVLKRLGPLNGRDTIWVDSLDEALTNDVLTGKHGRGNTVVSLLIELKARWPSWVRVVATSRPDEATRAALEPLSGASIDVENASNRQDIQEFVLQELSIIQQQGPAVEGGDAQACEAICAAAKGVIMYAREVLRQYKDFGFLDLEAPPESLSKLYMNRYQKTFSRDGLVQFAAHSRPMLEMLVAAREPLPVAVVARAESAEDAHDISTGKTKRTGVAGTNQTLWVSDRARHVKFVQRMCVGSLVEVGKLQLSHKSFADWLSDEESEQFCVDKHHGEKQLAKMCLQVCQGLGGGSSGCGGGTAQSSGGDKESNKDRRKRLKQEAMAKRRSPDNNASSSTSNIKSAQPEEQQQDSFTKYALKHGISHLLAAGRRPEARALVLENVAWLMARSGDGMGIMEDCRRLVNAAGEDRVVDLVRRALDLAMGDLRKDPRRLPGQLVGRLLGSGEGSAVPKGNSARGGAGAVGSGKDSHAEVVVRREVGALLRRLMEYRGYGFAWWCPVSRTLEQAGGACLRKMTGHTSGVSSVSFSADGRRVVSGSNDKTVRVWDAVSGECVLGPLEGHTSWVTSVSFSGDGRRAWCPGRRDKTVRVWDAVSGECVLGPLEGHTDW